MGIFLPFLPFFRRLFDFGIVLFPFDCVKAPAIARAVGY